jgi:hypothetical protein
MSRPGSAASQGDGLAGVPALGERHGAHAQARDPQGARVPGLVVGWDCGPGEDVAGCLLGVVVHIAPDLVPDVLHELPFVDEARPFAIEQEGGVQLAGPAGGLVPVEAHRALRRPERRLGLAAAARSLDEHRAGRAEPTRQFRVGEPGDVVVDSSEGVVSAGGAHVGTLRRLMCADRRHSCRIRQGAQLGNGRHPRGPAKPAGKRAALLPGRRRSSARERGLPTGCDAQGRPGL